jgi:hypothetical protein
MNDIVVDANKTMDVNIVIKSIKLVRLKNLAKYRVHVIVRDFIPADKLLAFLRELKQIFGDFIIHYELQKYKNILLIIPHYVRVERGVGASRHGKKHRFFSLLGDVKIIELKEVDDV